MCGIELSIISLVPDGGPGSPDVRWYCRDIISCTERWTAPEVPPARQAPAPRQDAAEPGAGSSDRQIAPEPGAEASDDENVPYSGGKAPIPGDAAAPADV